MTRAISLFGIVIMIAVGLLLIKNSGITELQDSPAEVAEVTTPNSLPRHDVDHAIVAMRAAPDGTNAVNTREIRFPDGETISIRLRSRPTKISIPNESSFLLDLTQAQTLLNDAYANGDASAAFRMWELRQFCETHLGDQASLEKALSDVYEQEHYAGPWGMMLVGEGSGQRIVDMADAVQRHYEQCRDIETREGDSGVDWLGRAAEMGSSDALKQQGRQLGKTRAAVQTFEQAWQQGEIYANAWLSHLYANGVADESGLTVQDPTQAYAHQYLFAALLEAKYSQQGGREHLFAQRAWDEVAKMETGLHAHELENAYEIAKALLHDGCCLR